MRTLLGLRKPLKGEVVTDGLALSEIGYLPQQTIVQRDFPASVKEIVLSGFVGRLGMKPFYSAKQKKTAMEAMKKFGVDSLASRCYRDLSGGQQQRVLLARALCATGKLILLDEPVTGLDYKVTCEFYGLLSELNKSGVSIVMVSHDLEEAMGHANKILQIGREQVFFGDKEDYLLSESWKTFHQHHKSHTQSPGTPKKVKEKTHIAGYGSEKKFEEPKKQDVYEAAFTPVRMAGGDNKGGGEDK
jgi:zinc transport system ATP-binding protein